MPKLVDHDLRRTEIAQATWTAVQDIGLERLRLRDIADEVGFTTGVFAHYFRDKDSVLRYAFNLAYQQTENQILRDNQDVGSGLERLKNALVALVPDKKRPETVAFISMCFGIRGINDPLLTSDYKKTRKKYARLIKVYLNDAIANGEICIAKSPEELLDFVFALLDGVCVAGMLNPDGFSKAHAISILETMTERLSVDNGKTRVNEYSLSRATKTKGATK